MDICTICYSLRCIITIFSKKSCSLDYFNRSSYIDNMWFTCYDFINRFYSLESPILPYLIGIGSRMFVYIIQVIKNEINFRLFKTYRSIIHSSQIKHIDSFICSTFYWIIIHITCLGRFLNISCMVIQYICLLIKLSVLLIKRIW